MVDVVLKIGLRCKIGDGPLLKTNRNILFNPWIRLLPEVLSELHQVDVLNLCAVLRTHIKPVRQVLYPDENLIAFNRMHPVRQVVLLAGILDGL